MKNIDELLKESKKIHFIGIGGAGMCPIAEILLSLGYELTGSDNNDTETFRRVEKEGAKVFLGQKPENIADDTQLVIYTNAILAGNAELEYAKANFPCFERAEALGALSRIFSNCIGVCGTHGKTTTSSMITQILMEAGLDPSAVIGGKLPLIDAYGRYGHSQNFVCESCEFNNTFLHMNPDMAVILNIDEDHLDFFGNLDNIKKSFNKFAHQTSNLVVYNGDNANAEDALEDVNIKKITFGLSMENDYYATNMQRHGVTQSYDLMYQGEFLTKINLSVPGIHNVYNSLAAITVADYLGVPIKDIAENIAKFTGVHRRFELLGKPNGITVVDDFAHHPTELTSTLETAMELGFNHVWAVFQPHTFSRTALLMDDFAKALKIPDTAIISAILPVRETNTYNVYNTDLGKKVPGSVCLETFDEITDYIVKNAKEGDLVLTMGGGNVYMCANQIVKALENK